MLARRAAVNRDHEGSIPSLGAIQRRVAEQPKAAACKAVGPWSRTGANPVSASISWV